MPVVFCSNMPVNRRRVVRRGRVHDIVCVDLYPCGQGNRCNHARRSVFAHHRTPRIIFCRRVATILVVVILIYARVFAPQLISGKRMPLGVLGIVYTTSNYSFPCWPRNNGRCVSFEIALTWSSTLRLSLREAIYCFHIKFSNAQSLQ